jgi:ethanolamine ammonia-lyase small subunit
MSGNSNSSRLIDDYGQIDETIKELEARRDQMKDEIKSLGAGNHVGSKFICIVSESHRDTLDVAAVKKKLKELLSEKTYEKFLKANTKVTEFLMVKASKVKEVKEISEVEEAAWRNEIT